MDPANSTNLKRLIDQITPKEEYLSKAGEMADKVSFFEMLNAQKIKFE